MTARRTFSQFFIGLAIVLGLIGPAALFGGAQGVHAHPALIEIGRAAPEQMVSVIVQKSDKTGHAEELTIVLGGKITKVMGTTNTFSARLAAGNALELAYSPSVRWIRLMAQAGTFAPNGNQRPGLTWHEKR
jgi:hypothetical protein